MKVSTLLKHSSSTVVEIIRNDSVDYPTLATVDYMMKESSRDDNYYGTVVTLPQAIKDLKVDFFTVGVSVDNAGHIKESLRIYTK